MTLDALTKDEVEATLGRRWPITLCQIDQTVLCGHIYEAVRPPVVWSDGQDQSRYQHRKPTVWPRRAPVLVEPRLNRKKQFYRTNYKFDLNEVMKVSSPAVYAYDLNAEKAVDIIWDRRLRDCELLSDPVLMLDFLNDTDLCHFKMAFGEDLDFTDNSAFARPIYKGQIESFLVERGMGSRVTRREIVAVAFWTLADKVTFDEELYLSSLQP
ncbi:hypothetical protein [Microvirga tunisiensis]|uniref:Uncharacterized protein n=1 Tax=Microvirga tunisiensis TaxID=2108360 RepID=A0A5N7MS39_9HYPH|nr:hypothetical protein [Microvirga tunisiensis]MPR11786.1 hypothetical protein [Microvirga tunisiensis]MPR29773.1 hypothetical protein [Microvirga tunisiensis]